MSSFNAWSFVAALVFLGVALPLVSGTLMQDLARPLKATSRNGHQPLHWYRFENSSDPSYDTITGTSSTIRVPASCSVETNNTNDQHKEGIVGGYLRVPPRVAAGIEFPHGYSIEFLFRTRGSGFWFNGGALDLLIDPMLIEIRMPWNLDPLVLSTAGVGMQSMNYITEGWHHLAISFDNTTFNRTLCIDGLLCVEGTGTSNIRGGFPFLPKPLLQRFDIDEVAIFDYALTRSDIYQQYRQTIVDRVPYTFDLPQKPVPPMPIANKTWNLKDFAPGSELPSNSSGTKGVTMTALEQLQSFPDPKYPTEEELKQKGIHTKSNDAKKKNVMHRNFNWMDPGYMGGRGQPGVSPAKALNNSLAIQKELYQRWNYGVVLSNLRVCCNADDERTIKEAAQYAESIDVIILRLQTIGGTQLVNHSLPNGCYAQTAEGKFLNTAAQIVPKEKASLRPMTPATAIKQGCPGSVFFADGEKFNTSIQNAQQLLQKYSNGSSSIYRVNNDGEAMNILSADLAKMDPVIGKDFKDSGDANWLTFWSKWRVYMSNPTFRDLFMNYLPDSSVFTQYQIQGTNPYFGNWTITRNIQSMIDGRFLSTEDFYPVHPDWIWGTHGPWHGMGWMQPIRESEIRDGNPLFSPFVAAGWSGMAENNIRPGAWLGLMKVFGAMGAVYYYSGFFSLGEPFPDSKNWIWQAAMPSYAQAITARYQDVLFDGEFMGYCNLGIVNVWCARRRLNVSSTTTKHIVALSITPPNNFEGASLLEMKDIAVELSAAVSVDLAARIQGSVYEIVVVNSTAGGGVPSVNVTQLDEWHEPWHPSWWAKQ